ncbi:SusC/RagA family TonB-linked outer membrane protein [Algibacter pectinivorans]|uniref:TonB-linked outer membrane protein, SusC/RagA family n=1 Tax=Algibacter pectinivorans TaxID=870482 RepID=A0A1I1PTV4_9FLAO|nr:TonB-dependent receptor [Algibacter pectinivorans]SFD13097.1 TonB-linked outer membrane protein, SusC/RagA family [Algibacter pectinivorans]
MRQIRNLKKTLLLLIGFCFALNLNAQQKTITGVVTSEADGIGLPGVNVIVKGTTTGASTDFDGNYSINVSGSDAVLSFSYVGYVAREVKVGSNNTINVALVEDLAALDEVVVVGYGARKKSDLTGSVSAVKSDELTAFPVLDAEQALQGRAAGVNVQSNNGGEPGAPISISIRGNTSINASSSPLIVVDGFVGGSMPQAGDIENLQVLKDASATAIYGSRGSNGVILVTTKKGRKGKLNVEFNSTYAIQNTSNRLDLLNANDFADYQNQIRANQGNTNLFPQGSADTDWQDEIYRSGNTSNNQLSFSGGSEKVNYYASGTYFQQDGILVNSGFERAVFLSNLDAQVTDKLKLGLNLTGTLSKKNGVATQSTGANGVGAGGDDVVALAMRFAPDQGVYNDDGTFSVNDRIGDPVDNPWAVATQRDDDTETEKFRANFYANYEIAEGLTFKTTFGLSSDNNFRGLYLPRTLQVTAGGVGGRAIMTQDKTKNILSENYLTYNKDIGNGNLTLLAGYSYQKTTNKGFYSEGTGTISDTFSYYGLYTATNLLNGEAGDIYTNETEIQSVFGRVNYDWNDKYLFTATVRRDGASNFAENEKYALFPSAALGWKISNEDFLSDSETISNLKLRASYGVTGNPSISAYQSLASLASIYASNNGETVASVTPNQPANPDLKWESSYQTNVGLDLGLLNNKVSLSLDYYNIDTKDLIMIDRGLPWYLGFYNDEILKNVGEINNKGFEISLNTRNITNDDFSWTTDFVFSKNKNTVEKLINGDDYFQNGAPSYFSVNNNVLLREGEEVGQFWGYDYAGVYQGGAFPEGTATIEDGVAGDPLFLDLDESGDITNDDRKIIGNPNPDFTWGITNSFRYKNFDANIFFQGSQGGEIFNMTEVQLNNGDANTTYGYFNNAWTPTNTSTNQPRVGNNSFREVSSRFVEDGSYIRLKNIAIGYNFPSEAIEKIGVERLRLSISAQNLLTITNYSGLDPEVNYFGSAGNNNTASNTVRGFDFGNYPTVKSVNFSLNVTF